MRNTLMTRLTQGECVGMVFEPERLSLAMGKLNPSSAVFTHGPAVSAYIASFDQSQGRAWLEALPRPELLDRPSMPHENPLAPCALLSAFRLAAQLNDALADRLPAGRFEAEGRAELERHVATLKGPFGTDAQTAEILAAVTSAEIARANWLTSRLHGGATQRECVAELFKPGHLRRRLERSGITLPLR